MFYQSLWSWLWAFPVEKGLASPSCPAAQHVQRSRHRQSWWAGRTASRLCPEEPVPFTPHTELAREFRILYLKMGQLALQKIADLIRITYSQWSELSCFKNLHHCKAEDNRGAHLCKMPTKDRWCCLHVPLLCPAQYWTRSDQLLLFALFCSGNKKGAGQSRTKCINSVTLRQGKILQKTLRIQVGAWVEIVQQKKSS